MVRKNFVLYKCVRRYKLVDWAYASLQLATHCPTLEWCTTDLRQTVRQKFLRWQHYMELAPIMIIIQRVSVACFARPLLGCACISFVYLLHGRLLLVSLYSMSKLNNHGSKARYSNVPQALGFVIWRHWRPSTYVRPFLNQPTQKLAFRYLQWRQRRGHGENLLLPLRFYVQERHPDQAT